MPSHCAGHSKKYAFEKYVIIFNMSWALRRQIFYVLVLVVFFLALGFLVVYPKLNKAGTCVE